MDFPECLERVSKLYYKQDAVLCGDTRYSYAEFAERVNRLGNALRALGVQKGDRVAFMGLNCHRQLEIYFAIPLIGAVMVPLNIRLSPQEITFIVNDAGSKVLFADEALLPMAQAIRPKLETVKAYVFMSAGSAPADMLGYEQLVADADPAAAAVPVDPNDIAGIFYTGGTTGRPKGAMLSHDNLMSNALQIMPWVRFHKGDVYLNVAPMFHLANGAGMFASVYGGATQAFVKAFTPDATLQAIERYKVTSALLVPTMINFVVNHPDLPKYDLSSLRLIVYGASPMPPELLRRAIQKLGCEFCQAYGMTEASPVLTILAPSDHVLEGPPEALARLASAGQPAYGVRLRVVNELGEDVKPGEVGEVIASGATIMKGYWNLPEETAAALRDGWYYTGDMAKVDDEFYVYIVDRAKDMIISGGENVYSTEVEAVLYTHPAVLEAAVIGVPDETWGEAVKAVVALKPSTTATPEELIAHCKASLASYKSPKSVDIVPALPKSGAGKILKREIREPYWAGRDRRVN